MISFNAVSKYVSDDVIYSSVINNRRGPKEQHAKCLIEMNESISQLK